MQLYLLYYFCRSGRSRGWATTFVTATQKSSQRVNSGGDNSHADDGLYRHSPVQALLFETKALTLLVGAAALAFHELVVIWDVAYAAPDGASA